jgi:hypothetical protein
VLIVLGLLEQRLGLALKHGESQAASKREQTSSVRSCTDTGSESLIRPFPRRRARVALFSGNPQTAASPLSTARHIAAEVGQLAGC